MTRTRTRRPVPSIAPAELTFSVASAPADRQAVLELRDLVSAPDRLDDANHTNDDRHANDRHAFDRFDVSAAYIVARAGDQALGVVKVIPDSDEKLPCETVASISLERAGRRLVEFGHFLTTSPDRAREVGLGLIRAALHYSIHELAATHVLGNFFVDRNGELRPFYRILGFEPLSEPFRDDRFVNAPRSLVAILDLAAARARLSVSSGSGRELFNLVVGAMPPASSSR